MNTSIRIIALLLALGGMAACANSVTGPPGVPSSSDVNPVTGTRGGSGASR